MNMVSKEGWKKTWSGWTALIIDGHVVALVSHLSF
jgi:hypothetical protein